MKHTVDTIVLSVYTIMKEERSTDDNIPKNSGRVNHGASSGDAFVSLYIMSF